MEFVDGYIDRIIFRNADNGYTVLSLHREEEELTCVGTFPFISEGEFVHLSGGYMSHPVYGQQFLIEAYELREPEDLFSIERYLGSGAIKGVGAALAARIVKRFKEDTFRIIEEEPERLSEIKGISAKMAREIYRQFEEKRDMRGAMLFLQQYNITGNLAVKIYTEYGGRMYDVLKENPYRLAEDIAGVGFKTADEIARRMGFGNDSDNRIKAGIIYTLLQASTDGHVYLPEYMLLQRAQAILGAEEEAVRRQLTALAIEKKVILEEDGPEKRIYSAIYYYMELNVARMLHDLNIRYELDPEAVRTRIAAIESRYDIQLEEQQRTAVAEAAENGLLIITGGPGTGKTTTINTMIKYFESEGLDILLAAPTGRAAKRMTEATGYEAKTIHRLLELNKLTENQENKFTFNRNESNPLETDVLIIDEMSMVDISLMHALLKAIPVGTRLILVGDVNQLPSVGPGNVLRDIIRSHSFNVVKLTKIFRQAADSDIIVNAHKINDGEQIRLDNKSRDFFFLRRGSSEVITAVMINLMKNKLPGYVQATPFDIQVLTPMRKGELGVERLNRLLQQALNPPDQNKREKEYHETVFREGDKVMQVKNNYQLSWEIRGALGTAAQTGTGVFNGDAGIIREINLFSEHLLVEFDDNRLVDYGFNQLDELELAYAVTIHKSQGSEYPAVILPLLDGPRLLFNRNLLYTAVTRAKSCVAIVGSDTTVQFMIDNKNEQNRYSGLHDRIRELQ